MLLLELLFSQTLLAYIPGVRASAIVDLGDSPKTSLVKISFDRQTSEEAALLVTSINLSHKNAPKRVDQLNVTPLSSEGSLLTGWFVAQQRGQELWVGLSLKKGENHGEITVNIPGMLSLVSDYPEVYELAYYKPNPMLSEFAASAASAKFAQLVSIKVTSPKWGEVVKDKTTGWGRIQNNYYSPNISGTIINVLTIKRSRSALGEWVHSNLGLFGGGLAAAMIAIAVLFGRGTITAKNRYLSLGVVSISSVLLLFIGGEWPPNLGIILFDGSLLLGFIVPFLMIVLLPTKWSEEARKFFEQLRTA